MIYLLLLYILTINCLYIPQSPIDAMRPRYKVYYNNKNDISYIIDYSPLLDVCKLHYKPYKTSFMLECLTYSQYTVAGNARFRDVMVHTTWIDIYGYITCGSTTIYQQGYIDIIKDYRIEDNYFVGNFCFIEYDKNDYIRFNNTDYIVNFREYKCIYYLGYNITLYCDKKIGKIIINFYNSCNSSNLYKTKYLSKYDKLFNMSLITKCDPYIIYVFNETIKEKIIYNYSYIHEIITEYIIHNKTYFYEIIREYLNYNNSKIINVNYTSIGNYGIMLLFISFITLIIASNIINITMCVINCKKKTK